MKSGLSSLLANYVRSSGASYVICWRFPAISEADGTAGAGADNTGIILTIGTREMRQYMEERLCSPIHKVFKSSFTKQTSRLVHYELEKAYNHFFFLWRGVFSQIVIRTNLFLVEF